MQEGEHHPGADTEAEPDEPRGKGAPSDQGQFLPGGPVDNNKISQRHKETAVQDKEGFFQFH